MARIAFLILAHKAPAAVAFQARLLSGRGDFVAVHYDARAPEADWLRLVEALAGLPRVHLVRRRIRCGWGEWSLVAATLELVRAGLAAFPEASHFYLLSGDCMPIRPVAELRAHLDATPRDHIESVDFFASGWIKTGLREERLIYRHPFNERGQPRAFAAALWLQRRLGLHRPLPAGLPVRIGSQWWCLRRATLETVLSYCARRPAVVRFFRWSWIPDETFFQTLVAHLVPAAELSPHPLTRLMFSDYGMPVCFHADQVEALMAEDGFFVRKLAPGAAALRARLAQRFGEPAGSAGGGDLAGQYRWLARRGREGRRTPPPPWSAAAPELTAIICKKWHTARQLAERVAAATGQAAIGHVFDERAAGEPDLGGYGRTLGYRRAEPLAYLGRVAQALGARRLVLCLDPCQIALIEALRTAGARLLRLDCAFDPEFVAGHCRRIGLDAGLVATVAAELAAERAALDALGPGAATVVAAGDPLQAVARRLARALDIGDALAVELAAELDLTGG